jgi:hypothetical protein
MSAARAQDTVKQETVNDVSAVAISRARTEPAVRDALFMRFSSHEIVKRRDVAVGGPPAVFFEA